MSGARDSEDIFLESVLLRYVAEGFTVVRHPSHQVLPPFMGKYRPDAIALRADRKIAIEIKRDPLVEQTAFKPISQMFEEHRDWEFKVYYLPKFPQERDLKPPTRKAIKDAIEETESLRASGHFAAALMLAWAALEAIGRDLLPKRLLRPQPAGQLVEVLASEGLVAPAEADLLRRGVALRNAVAHGDFSAPATAERVDDILKSLQMLASLRSRDRATVGSATRDV